MPFHHLALNLAKTFKSTKKISATSVNNLVVFIELRSTASTNNRQLIVRNKYLVRNKLYYGD